MEMIKRLGEPFPPWPITSCRSVFDVYERLNKIQEGSYGVVHRGKNIKTGEIVALKKFKIDPNATFPISALREIGTLIQCDHPNIVTAKEVVVGKDHNSFFLVMPFLEHDLKDLMQAMRDPFLRSESKCLLQQILRGLAYMHDNWIIHRDLKSSNLLLSNKGIVKIADFGLARRFVDVDEGKYTPGVVTLAYRAPEVLLGSKNYTEKIDIWSVGCIFGELLTNRVLIPGTTELGQLGKIFQLLGTPNDHKWKGWKDLPLANKITSWKQYIPMLAREMGSCTTDAGLDLLQKFLKYNPEQRISAREALNHPYFTETPLPRDPALIQTFPSLHEGKPIKRTTNGEEAEHIFSRASMLQTEAHTFGLDPYGQAPSGFKLKF